MGVIGSVITRTRLQTHAWLEEAKRQFPDIANQNLWKALRDIQNSHHYRTYERAKEEEHDGKSTRKTKQLLKDAQINLTGLDGKVRQRL
jgi:hypothetical protein